MEFNECECVLKSFLHAFVQGKPRAKNLPVLDLEAL